MPTYEYECTKCTNRFERFQGMNDEPVRRCPKCRCKVRRLVGSGAGIIFKGSGFYQTDYKKTTVPASERAESSSSSSESKSETKSEAKSDSKTETKTESSTKSKDKDNNKKTGK